MKQDETTTIAHNFIAWLNQIYEETQDHSSYYKFINNSKMNGNTVTRWRNDKQVPTLYSVEKIINEYVEYTSSIEKLNSAVLKKEILLKIIGMDAYVRKLLKKINRQNRKLKILRNEIKQRT